MFASAESVSDNNCCMFTVAIADKLQSSWPTVELLVWHVQLDAFVAAIAVNEGVSL